MTQLSFKDKGLKLVTCLLKLFLCTAGVLFILFLASTFPVLPSIWNTLCFFLVFAVLPCAVFLLYRKSKGVRFYILACIVILIPLLIWYYCGHLTSVDHGFESYLTEDTSFTKNAAAVMPSKDSLDDAQVVFYEYEDHGDDLLQIYRLSAVYEENEFLAEKQRLDEQYERSNPSEGILSDDFYLDGVFYSCYTFFDQEEHIDYAMAYHACEETKTISYIFFRDPSTLFTMTAGSALSCTYEDCIFEPGRNERK